MDVLTPALLSPVLAVGGLDFLDPQKLINDFGHLGLILVIFAESCVFPVLPGDSLLFTAGFLVGQGTFQINIVYLCLTLTLAAIAGNQVGYLTGRRLGTSIFRDDRRFFKTEYLDKTHAYFEHHGPKTIVIARFIPFVRTFACIVAGAAKMDYRLFVTYNIVGAILWATGITLVGWGLHRIVGEFIDIDTYLLPIVGLILVISFVPVLVEYIKAKRHFKAPAGEVSKTIKEEI